MKMKFAVGMIVATMGLASACRSATEVETTDLEGTWIASQARIVDIEQPKESNFDLIELGFTAVFNSDGTGAFELRLISPEDEGQLVTGTLVIDGTDVVVTTDSTTSAGEVFVEDDQAALSITAGLTYDFKGDGTEKPAKLLLVMDRVRPEE
jgi:type 1 fimbria pilin